jgi:SAM-dependent methyltransferase
VSERIYGDLAEWWPVLAPKEGYREEARDLLAVARGAIGRPVESWLELGSGVGLLSTWLPEKMNVTLVDSSESMLRVSRRFNPNATHVAADLRTLNLGRQFDAVQLHDAVMYMTSLRDLKAAIRAMAAHLKPGGVAIVVPDVVKESFAEGHVAGGDQARDGRAARLLEWHWDPDPRDTTFLAEMSFLLRDADGTVRSVHETHTMGLFPRRAYVRALESAGLRVVDIPRKMRARFGEIFAARRP